ncbi:MAG: 2-phospho-L-lactate guanylyltransferase, partial [Nitrososphaeraceae archaeon]
MKIAAIIPMKSLHLAKSRLSNILTPEQRKNLAMYLLDATIKELKESKFISEIIIVSSDKAVKKYSCLNNLKFIKDSDEGVNNAVILAD